jgi:ribosomal protein S18 acetylase RimI-like enzyme
MSIKKLEIRPYHPSDEHDVIQLWLQCRLVTPANNPKRDIERKLKITPELFLIATVDGKIVGTCMAGYEGHRGWINYLAVAPEHQRQGIARTLIEVAEGKLRALGCPKINLQVRETNTGVIAFYQKVGYAIDPVVSLGKRLEYDPAYQPE